MSTKIKKSQALKTSPNINEPLEPHNAPAWDLEPRLNAWPPNFSKATHFHLLGVGGVGMTALAGLLKSQGYTVTGSDEAIFPPMSEVLKALDIPVRPGYGPDSLDHLPLNSIVVVGNVVTRKFEVIKALKEQGRFYLSLPQTLGKLFLSATQNIVVAGCHGKTTVTNLVATLLEKANLAPGYLIGGQSLDLEASFKSAQNNWFVIEGDEYDSAFFQKVPKFVFYKPYIVILTSVDFDHADIYPNLEAVIKAYESLIYLIPEQGLLLANGDDPLCRQLAKKVKGKVNFYGQNFDNDWIITNYRVEPRQQTAFDLRGPGLDLSLKWSRPGLHNALNAGAALVASFLAGVNAKSLPKLLAQIQGVKRRQEFLGSWGDIGLIDDFAHHPTAVAQTIKALKDTYIKKDSKSRLIAVFEPRSATTRRAIFQNDYVAALAEADVVFLGPVNRPDKAPEGDRLNPLALAEAISAYKPASYFPALNKLGQAIIKTAQPGDVIAVLSNGDFGGLTQKLARDLAKAAKKASKDDFLNFKDASNKTLTPSPALLEKIKEDFKDPDLWSLAITHRSSPLIPGQDNQRLEFLGDAVLGLMVSELLYVNSNLSEGRMSQLRAFVVNEKSLTKLARLLDLGSYLIMSPGEEATGGREKNSILADALEALVGAYYLSNGSQATKRLIQVLWGPLIKKAQNTKQLIDFKTRLQELTQSQGRGAPTYELVKTIGPDNDRVFTMAVSIPGSPVFTAKGRTKKWASQLAARALLTELLKNER
ncbi:MAG: ribonuclease III [Deltaproteobacteria bacterium]|nr:ribonuclease III [Deltaproteobacteria bacterium]